MFKRLIRRFGPNPFEKRLQEAAKQGQRSFLIPWNRGLGDIALGLYAMVYRIRKVVPESQVTFVTRKDLADGFRLLEGVETLVSPHWVRHKPFSLKETMEKLGRPLGSFDVVIENADPTHWVKWQLGTLVPELKWDKTWDEWWKKFGLDASKTYVAVHVHTETHYGYEKNWQVKQWTELFQRLHAEHGMHVILFGMQQTHSFPLPGVVDLRGKTNFLDMLSIIKNCSEYMIAPDSGVLSLTYYLKETYPIHIVSLWADPNQGILKQAVASPNPQLVHVPLIGHLNDISTISVDAVVSALVQR